MSDMNTAQESAARMVNEFTEAVGRCGMPLVQASRRAAQGMAEFEQAVEAMRVRGSSA